MAKTLLFVLIGVCAGLAGGGAAVLLSGNEAAGDSAGAPPPSEAAEEIAELSRRIAALEEEVRTLRAAPPMAEAPAAPIAEPETAEETAAASAAAPLPEAIQEQVAKEVRESRDKEREAMGRRFSEMAKQREAGALDRMVEKHGLTAYQREEMEKILERRRQAIGEFFRQMFAPGEGEQADLGEVRKKMADVRDETEKEIQALLSPDQYEAWQTEQPRGRGPGFGPGGGRRPR
jgi:hypothetical protein